MDLAETFPSLVKNGNRVYVWGQDGREPEVALLWPFVVGSARRVPAEGICR